MSADARGASGKTRSANGYLMRSRWPNTVFFCCSRPLCRAATPKSPRPLRLRKFSRSNFHSRANRHLPHLLLAASVSIPTTIGRRFRHRKHKILWFVYEFFLTSFPQPPILRFQARGRISWLQLFRCAQPVVEPDRVNRKSRGALPHLTPRLGFLARLSWAFVSFFSARTALFAALRSSCSPQSIIACTATVHITSPTGRRLGVE